MLTTPKLKELQRPKLIHKLPLLPATSTQKFHAIPLNDYGEMPSKRYAMCVATFTMPVHLHGAYFVSFCSSLEDATMLKQLSFCSF